MSTQTYEGSVFQLENDQLLKWVLDKRIFEPLKDETKNELRNHSSVEIYITPECNLKCEYCYLYRHGDKLYPKEIRDHKAIINNLHILLEHFLEEEYNIPDMELFSGEIWGTQFSAEILDTLLEYIDKGLSIGRIVIPSNATFITSEKATAFMQEYIDRFDVVGVPLILSASIDGLIIEEKSRSYKDESKNTLRDQKYYDRLFEFCAKNHFGLHPMVSAKTSKYWIENHKWFLEMMRKYKISYDVGIMLLEVRNDDWTQEDIDAYLEFIAYLIDELRENFYLSDEEMADDIFRYKEKSLINNYNAIMLSNKGDTPGCTIHRTIHIRLGDLAIVPCHRLSYDALNYGHYRVENGKIVGIESNNVQFALRTYMTNIRATHNGCDACPYNYFCVKGCMGAQLEGTGDPFFCCESVCNLEKQKIDFMIKKYEKIGLIKILKKEAQSNFIAKEVLENIEKIKNLGGASHG